VEETGVSRENHRPATSHWQTLSQNVVSSTPRLSGFELTTLVVMCTDCIGSYKSNYYTITTAPIFKIYIFSLRKKQKLGLYFSSVGDMIYWFWYFYFELLSLKDYCSLLYFYIQLTIIFWGYSFLRIGMCTLADLTMKLMKLTLQGPLYPRGAPETTF
jgi:hypothetical protein